MQVVAALESLLPLLGHTLDLIWRVWFNLDCEMVDVELLTNQSVCLAEHLLMLVEVSVLEREMDRQQVLLVAEGPDVQVMDVLDAIDLAKLRTHLVVVDAIRRCLE